MTDRELEQQIAAVHQSAEKWWGIAVHGNQDRSSEDCACCQMFKKRGADMCKRCPIKQKTDQIWCRGTNYTPWHWHHRQKHYSSCFKRVICEECADLAMNFYDELVDLEEELILKLELR